MKRRHKTLIWIALGAAVLGGGTVLGAVAMKKTVSFFYSPKDVLVTPPKLNRNVRLGGLVMTGSIKHTGDGVIDFVVTDNVANINVSYKGIVPDLFREGQGVIAEGKFTDNNNFKADRILAKHDENYVPKEVADSLKKSGEWRGPEAALKEQKQP
jgi:cytochrome c-type biogenesis protein CcmE